MVLEAWPCHPDGSLYCVHYSRSSDEESLPSQESYEDQHDRFQMNLKEDKYRYGHFTEDNHFADYSAGEGASFIPGSPYGYTPNPCFARGSYTKTNFNSRKIPLASNKYIHENPTGTIGQFRNACAENYGRTYGATLVFYSTIPGNFNPHSDNFRHMCYALNGSFPDDPELCIFSLLYPAPLCNVFARFDGYMTDKNEKISLLLFVLM